MAITELGHKKFLIRVYVGREPVTKKRIEINETFYGTRREAEKCEQTLKVKAWKGSLSKSPWTTVSQLIESYLEETKRRRENSSQWRIKAMFHRYVIPYIGNLHVTKVTTRDVQEFLDFLSYPKKGSPP
jgi:hypothetical protein